ncbi:hypothetical protein [Endozoicomonas sp. YOMI1]|uniref:hypothetical protein n=1 Tax=Endozoicomonas sp. YOMI1 TaxID=2828739 RepID=UPI00214970FC|nr:hypothetical protein [Endozoicomonas sp. YOMI1]
MNNSASVGGLRSFPPSAYRTEGKDNPDSTAAAVFGQSIIRYCFDGELNKEQLSRLLDRTIKYIEEQTGVLPSVVSGAAANNPASNNQTDPDLWDWNQWENRLFGGKSIYGSKDLPGEYRRLICRTLGDNIGPDEGKILALVRHPIFEQSLQDAGITTNKLIPLDVRGFIRSEQCYSIFDKLLRFYENFGNIKPAGLIKSAIALGYLPREDIEQLVQVGRR